MRDVLTSQQLQAFSPVVCEKFVMQRVLETNQVVDHLKNHHVVLKVHHIPEEQVRHLVISDASYDPTGKVKRQHGWIQALTTPQLNRGEVAPVSLMSWKSRRLRRKAGNTLLCESIALSTALGAMEKQVAVWRSFCKSKYDPRETAVAVSEEVQMGLRGPGTVIASESVNFRLLWQMLKACTMHRLRSKLKATMTGQPWRLESSKRASQSSLDA